MPRGVYARKSAHKRPHGKAQREAATPAASAAPVSMASVATTPAADMELREFSAADFRRSIDTMSGALLKAYARSIGILQRDVDSLSEDRLRQNCRARVFEMLGDA